LEYVPFSHATLWRRVKEKTFPAPIKLSERVTVWRLEEVHAWMDEMTAKHRAA
jgi:predicted DNA-binding transcriptional regulator AlpA